MRESTFLPINLNTCIHHLYFLESFLKTLFIVSDVSIGDDDSLGMSFLPWLYVDSVRFPGEILVPPSLHRLKGHSPGQ